MKKNIIITLLTVLALVSISHLIVAFSNSDKKESIKVGIMYVGDSCNIYTNNFIRAEEEIKLKYGDSVEIIAKYNVSEGDETAYLQQLVDEKCDLIFATSYGYGDETKRFAEKYPNIQFCGATCDNANTEPVLSNYHNYMGEIYQGRYITGVVAGMKLKELIDNGTITKEQAVVGYIAAFPYSEVISGYTAFLLGVRSVVEDATMKVVYTNSWGEYNLEKKYATRLIKEGCVIISQHSDTAGPAVACEELRGEYVAYHVGYNQSTSDVAPTTSLISSRINWQHYMLAATGAVLEGKKIENAVSGHIYGNDASGGISEGWVQILKPNNTIVAPGTNEAIKELEERFIKGDIEVFKGNYTGTDPFDPTDKIDLKDGFIENADSSAPKFHYVLDGIITVGISD